MVSGRSAQVDGAVEGRHAEGPLPTIVAPGVPGRPSGVATAPGPRPLGPALLSGTRIGVRTFAEMALAMVPAYFVALLLEQLGVIGVLSDWAAPVMKLMGLPGSAALPLVLACLLNLYAAVGAMQALPLTGEQITVLAIVMLISHNLLVEGAVVQKAGMNGMLFSLLRLAAGLAAGVVVNLLYGVLS